MAGQEKPTIKHCKHLLSNLKWTLGLWYILQSIIRSLHDYCPGSSRDFHLKKMHITLHITLPFQTTLKSANIWATQIWFWTSGFLEALKSNYDTLNQSAYIPSSSIRTRECSVACCSILEVSLSSTKNVLSPNGKHIKILTKCSLRQEYNM